MIIDNFLHIINQRKVANIFQSSEINWLLNMFPSTGNKSSYLNFEQTENQIADSPTMFHILYMKQDNTDISPHGELIIKLFQQAIEKQINAKIEIIRCMTIMVMPNPNFTAQSMIPHVDWGFPHETCIYYINSVSSGDTVLFDQKYDTSLSLKENDAKKKNIVAKINPVQGKAILFDGLQYHAANPSKTDLRFVLNVNYVRV